MTQDTDIELEKVSFILKQVIHEYYFNDNPYDFSKTRIMERIQQAERMLDYILKNKENETNATL